MVTCDNVLTIGTPKVTKLFRDELVLEPLEKLVLPGFKGHVDIASIGCSDGREPYSIISRNWEKRKNLAIDAFDKSEVQLDLANVGRYNVNQKDLSRLIRCGIEGEAYEILGNIYWGDLVSIAFTDEAKKHISFLPHDIHQSPLKKSYDVVVMANVLYHYSFPELIRILENVVQSMKPSAWLICESCEDHGKSPYSKFMRNLSHLGLGKQPFVMKIGSTKIDLSNKTKLYRKF